MKSSVFAFIFARGGSKGVPRKNIREVAGKPLLAHAIACARASAFVSRVIVSTDDEEIAATALRYGAEAPFLRPPELAQDASPEWAAWRHALEFFGCTATSSPFDIFLSVPTTAPLRLPEDINACVAELDSTDADMVLTVRAAERHPCFNMVRLDDCGRAALAMPLSEGVSRRQDAPPLYDVTTVAYAARPLFLMRADSMFEGVVRTVLIPQERALDIDSEYDLSIADFLLRERLKTCAP